MVGGLGTVVSRASAASRVGRDSEEALEAAFPRSPVAGCFGKDSEEALEAAFARSLARGAEELDEAPEAAFTLCVLACSPADLEKAPGAACSPGLLARTFCSLYCAVACFSSAARRLRNSAVMLVSPGRAAGLLAGLAIGTWPVDALLCGGGPSGSGTSSTPSSSSEQDSHWSGGCKITVLSVELCSLLTRSAGATAGSPSSALPLSGAEDAGEALEAAVTPDLCSAQVAKGLGRSSTRALACGPGVSVTSVLAFVLGGCNAGSGGSGLREEVEACSLSRSSRSAAS
jgi:hypothetical protein